MGVAPPDTIPHTTMSLAPPQPTPNPWITPQFLQGLSQLGLTLTDHQIRQFQLYQQTLEEWNQRFNLTRITDRERVQTLHFLDSLTAALAIPPNALRGGQLIDVGTGAGFPGTPLKIAFPGLRLTLLESAGKKVAFLEHLLGVLGVSGVQTIKGRAETLARQSQFRESFNVVLARAVAPMSVLAELTLPFCKAGGVVVAHKKGNIAEELEAAQDAIDILGGRLSSVIPVSLIPPSTSSDENRVLVILQKTSPTPDRYPRRPGIPKKRPL